MVPTRIHPNLVSVIIPLFNRRAYIEETIESALGQTYERIEVIVVDDGSTDGGRELVASKYANRVQLISHENTANKGQSASLNSGLASAKGEFIAFLDSDDYFFATKIVEQVAYLQQNNDVGLVYSNGIAIDDRGAKLYDIYEDSHKEGNNPSDVLLDCYFFVPTNSLIRRTILDRVGGFNENLRAGQDHDMAIRIAETTKLGYLAKHAFAYRRHADSISAKKASVRWNNGLVIVDAARRRYPHPKRVILRRKAVIHFRLFQCCLEEHKYTNAVRHLLLAGLLDPVRALKVLLGIQKLHGLH